MSNTEILPAPEIDTAGAELSKWEREKRAFRALLPSLLPAHRGSYVAVHNEQVVASGTDQLAVAREAYSEHDYVPIYVGLVTDVPARPVRVPSPRVETHKDAAEGS